MKKRGQLALFVIIAVIVIALALLFNFLILPRMRFPKSEASLIKNYIEGCLGLKAKEAILLLAKQGGYASLPEEKASFLGEASVYYPPVPSAEKVESELEKLIKVDDCFSLQAYKIERKNCSIKARIAEKVLIDFNCPLKIRKGNAMLSFEKFSFALDAPLSLYLSVSEEIIKNYNDLIKKNEKTGKVFICSTCVDDIGSKHNVSIRAIHLENDLWFLISDKNKNFEGHEIIWRFVTKL